MNAPMITPRTIINPIFPRVSPKPEFIELMISFKGMPAENPYKMETVRSTINGWILSFAEKKTMKTIERNNSNNKYMPKIIYGCRKVPVKIQSMRFNHSSSGLNFKAYIA